MREYQQQKKVVQNDRAVYLLQNGEKRKEGHAYYTNTNRRYI